MSAELYGALKALHIVSFVAWMAGLFYLPRLFVYHTRLEVGSAPYAMFCEMERKLLVIIMRPAAIATWIFGLAMAADIVAAAGLPLWLGLKIAFVLAMTYFHFRCADYAAAFRLEKAMKSERHYRLINEIPTLLLVAIVVLAVFQP